MKKRRFLKMDMDMQEIARRRACGIYQQVQSWLYEQGAVRKQYPQGHIADHRNGNATSIGIPIKELKLFLNDGWEPPLTLEERTWIITRWPAQEINHDGEVLYHSCHTAVTRASKEEKVEAEEGKAESAQTISSLAPDPPLPPLFVNGGMNYLHEKRKEETAVVHASAKIPPLMFSPVAPDPPLSPRVVHGGVHSLHEERKEETAVVEVSTEDDVTSFPASSDSEKEAKVTITVNR